MSSSFKLSAVSVVASLACALAPGMLVPAAHAATPITVTSQSALDGPIRYTVRVTSKQFGNSQETRTIRSGESDDFTWKTVPPGGPVAGDGRVSELCVAAGRHQRRDDSPDADPLCAGRRQRRHGERADELPGADAARREECDERRQNAQVSERRDA